MNSENASAPRMLLALGLVTVVSAALLAAVYAATAAPVARAAARARTEAIAAVVPEFDNSPADEAVTLTPADGGEPLTLYPATLGGRAAGAAVQTYSDAGFSGRISLMVGFDPSGTVTGYRVMAHSETPGLGAKMETWFRDPRGHRSVIGRDASRGPLAVTADGGDIDAITAATISSRAFLDAVNRAYSCFTTYYNEPR